MSALPDRLWVLWRAFDGELPEGARVLSFLTPPEEERLAARCRLIRAREAVQEVRAGARARYLRLVANLGLAPLPDGRTLRQALAPPGGASRWWFHPVSFKDPDGTGDRAYDWLLAIETIRSEAAKSGARSLATWGAPAEVEAVLRQAFAVESRAPRFGRRLSAVVLRGLASRLKGLAAHLRHIAAAAALPKPELKAQVALFGFWDWSVRRSENGALVDRYFKALPDELSRAGGTSAWLLWLDPDFEPGRAGRAPAAVARALVPAPQAALLQQWLTASDAFRASLDLSPAWTYIRHRRSAGFKAAATEDGTDYTPLFEERLLRFFLDASMPRFELAALAAERALKDAGAKLALTFLEHFSFGRAFEEGARRAGVLSAAMQHASVCRDKTFYLFEPRAEFRGEPDGCGAPKPDHVFAMGSLGREIFLEAGHAPDRVHLTGSARYDHVREPQPAKPRKGGRALRVLVMLTLEAAIELDMLEAAALAARGLEGLEVFCRNYPFTRIEDEPRFAPLRGEIEVTRGSFEEDLAASDLVLVSYSTVGEESLIAGKPVWQWLPTGYNGSSLSEVEGVARFSSVPALRAALEEFRADPARFAPAVELRRRVLERLFFRGDGRAAARMAEVIRSLLPA